MAGKKVATRRSANSKAMAQSVQERLAARVRTQQEHVEADTSNLIKVKRSGFEYQGLDLGTEFECVILGSIFENVWYDREYDPDDKEVHDPICFAFNSINAQLAPPSALKTAINKKCDGCPKNEFGSASRGKGKACRNYRRVAVVPWDSVEGKANTEEIGIIRIAPTGLQTYAKFVNKIVTMGGKDPVQFVTQFAIDQTQDYPKIKPPTIVEEIENQEMLSELLSLPYEEVLNQHAYSMTPTPVSSSATKKLRARSRV